jgi:hypothetical protein
MSSQFFQFQILVLFKGTKELGVAHFIVDAPSICCHSIICYSVDLKKTKVHNMFKTKPVSSTIVITPKLENVLVNLAVIIIIRNQQPK